ncbi:ABC transporter substrate-binding protein [Plantactinospora sp. GCM10030261]|uniref:ABC transporter substrate-binding protein n=1 Tax=Plantactinospora sp. GCM10030261 TaxID=3273420 RepID=UPI00361C2400
MPHVDRRQILKLLAALGGGGLVGACGTSEASTDDEPVDADPIRIGLIAPRSGVYKAIGDDIRNGFQLFLELNENRLGGYPVELIGADEGDSADSGKAAVDTLLKQDVLALTGVVDSSVMLGIRDMVEQAKVPLVASNASPTSLQSVFYIWRTSYVNDEAGQALGPYVKANTKGRVSTISPQTPAGTDAVNGFRQSFGPGDSRLRPPLWTGSTASPSDDALDTQITRLLAQQPESVFCFFAGDAAVRFLRRLHEAGYRKKIFGPGFLTEGNVLSELKPAEAENITTALNYSSDLKNGPNREFASAYRKAHSVAPSTYAMASYDAAQVLDKAIRIVEGEPTPPAVNLALGRVGQVDSPRGPWQFNQPRTPQQKWYLRQVRTEGQVLANVLVEELGTLG